MAIHIRKDDGRVIVVYQDPETKKIKHESFGRGPLAMAKAEARNRELGFGRRRSNREQSPTLHELIDIYAASKRMTDHAKHHLLYRMDTLLKTIGDRPVSGLTYSDIDAYVSTRLNVDRVKGSTVRRALTDLKAILNHAVKRQPPLITVNPIRDYPMPKEDDEIIDPPTIDEVAAILAHAVDHLRRFIMLSFYLGARPGPVEILSLSWDDVSWDRQTIRVTSARKGGPVIRYVPIKQTFLPLLRAWSILDGGKGRIVHYFGKPVQSIKKAWRHTLDRAGITRRIRPYDLRHHFITHALESGADIKALSEVVGSAPKTLIKHYQHIRKSQHVRTVEMMPEIPEIPIETVHNVVQNNNVNNRKILRLEDIEKKRENK